MSTCGYWAAVSAIFLLAACNQENQRPVTPGNGTTLSPEPTAPSVAPNVTDTATPAPNTAPGMPDNDSRGTAMPGTRGTNDGSQLAPHQPSEAPNGTRAPSEGPNGAPVGGIH